MQEGNLLTIYYYALQNALMCKKKKKKKWTFCGPGVDIILLQVNKTLGFLIFHRG